MKKILIRICIVLVALIIVAALAVHFFLDSAIKRGVETVGPKLAKVDVTLDGVHLSLLSGSGKLDGLVIGNPEGYKSPHAISVGTAALALKPSTLLSDKLVISSINVESPEITYEGLAKSNLKQILDNLNESTAGSKNGTNTAAAVTPKEEKKASKKLEVDDFQITNAKLNFSITGVGDKSLTLPTIHLSNLGTDPDGITAAELSKQVIAAIESAAAQAVASDSSGLTKYAGSLTKGLGKNTSGTVSNLSKGLGGLIKGN